MWQPPKILIHIIIKILYNKSLFRSNHKWFSLFLLIPHACSCFLLNTFFPYCVSHPLPMSQCLTQFIINRLLNLSSTFNIICGYWVLGSNVFFSSFKRWNTEYNCIGDKFCSSSILEIDCKAKIAEREVH